MTSETPIKCVGDSEQSPPDPSQPNSDLTTASSTVCNNINDQDQDSSQSSPTKRNGNTSNPSKFKYKRKNEARKRSSGSGKKQAASNNNDDQSERQGKQQARSSVSPQNTSSAPLKIPQGAKDEPENAQNVEPLENNPQHQQPQQRQQQHYEANEGNNTTNNPNNINNWRRQADNKERAREFKELKEQLKTQNMQIQMLVEQVKQQVNKTKELETAYFTNRRTCNQLEQLLQKELASRSRLETENDSLNQAVSRLKTQLSVHEKNKFNNDELIRVLNATLMERETEVSILKLKLTRLQTNPSSTVALNSASSVSSVRHDPCQVYAATGRSNSEFDRNSYIRSSMIAEAASARASTSQLRANERDASVWATVPEELTPSKRPLMLERTFRPIYKDLPYDPYGNVHSLTSNQTSTPISRDRRYRTLPRSMKSPCKDSHSTKDQQLEDGSNQEKADANQAARCQVTNLDDGNSTSHSSGNRTVNSSATNENRQQTLLNEPGLPQQITYNDRVLSSRPQETPVHFANSKSSASNLVVDSSHYSTISKTSIDPGTNVDQASTLIANDNHPSLPVRTQTSPVKFSTGLKKIFDKFKRSDSSTNSQSKTDLTCSTPTSSPFKRTANRSTLVGLPTSSRTQMSPMRQAMNFQTDKPFAEWDTDMLVDWLTMIGLSMYTNQCRRWVKCGAHIMNATPAEVDRGLGITNPLHRKKLRLAISELNGDCDKVTKSAAKLDYLWVARWLDDVGLPQYKEAFINARVDGRVLNYLTVEDLVSMGVKSILHHASIRCGIRVLRSINFDLNLLKRRATAEEAGAIGLRYQQMNQPDDTNSISLKPTFKENCTGDTDVPLWTCHRVMEWLRLIDFAEFAPNLRGSGVHGGLIVFEDGFIIDTMCSLLSIPVESTLLRRHLSTYFKELIGDELAKRKFQYKEVSSNQQLNPTAEVKTSKRSQLWFTKIKSSKVGQDGMDEYLCPTYPAEPQLIKTHGRKNEISSPQGETQLSKIPESINV